MDFNRNWQAIRVGTLLSYVFLLFPLFIVVILSFSESKFPTFPPKGVSLEWFQTFFSQPDLLGSLFNSFVVAIGTAIVAGFIGMVTAIGFVRRDFPAKSLFSSVMFLPLFIGHIVIGISLTAYLTRLGMQKSYLFLILGHTILTAPYVFITVRAQLTGFNETLEEAALTMGANELETFFEVTLPLISPGLAAGMLLSFVISFGEFTATQFWVQPGTMTAPIKIYTMVRTQITPTVNAMASVLIVLTIVLPLVINYFSERNLILEAS